ncbi:TspO/MBR family protein [Arthrobacter russicus]|jgi:benzodiazapine receptor|uniref:Tryptophan-rich sensory protein n=1 Tax=Arthrobacter russicus TaxID=172040 RepID=A0ABU1J6G7_9MICC|nr:TspO/MBR family protein [Arthrobacter russicus]MDN5668948.1 tryptophan-rich sensory protein [Renibacterium salmoninarum]MDR6268013.1 tryptophan-rich sensory protein [Arthrobacter russicus]
MHTDIAKTPGPVKSLLVLLAYLLLSSIAAAIGVLANFTNIDGWYATADKAPWSPPNWLFGPVWTFLYIAMAIAAWLVWRKLRGFRPLLGLYGAQLLLNAVWSPLFFALYPALGAPALWLAAVVIVALAVSLVFLIREFWAINRWAAVLLIPYLIWVTFASSLNVFAALHN